MQQVKYLNTAYANDAKDADDSDRSMRIMNLSLQSLTESASVGLSRSQRLK